MSAFYFAVNHEVDCESYLLHVRTLNHPGMDSDLSVKRQKHNNKKQTTKLQSSVTAGLRRAMRLNELRISPTFSAFWPSVKCIDYVSGLHTDTDRQKTNKKLS